MGDGPGESTMETPPIEFEKVSFDEAKKALDQQVREVREKLGAKAFHHPRAPQRDEPLFESTMRWMAALPKHLQPIETARAFPRVANKLAEIWKRPSHCESYFQSLLLDQRGGRK